MELCVISIWNYYIYTKRLKELNNILQETVNDAVIRNDEKRMGSMFFSFSVCFFVGDGTY